MPVLVKATWVCSICGWEGSELAARSCERWHRTVLEYLGALEVGPESPGEGPIYRVRRRYRRNGAQHVVSLVSHYIRRTNGESTKEQKEACRVVLAMLEADPITYAGCEEDDDDG